MSARKYIGSGLLIGGGAVIVGGVWYAMRKSSQTTDAIEEALDAKFTPGQAKPAPTVKLRLTGYWPFTATASERKMEGGLKDRKGKPLHTVEDFLAGKTDHVSLSGDDAVWPYGQRIDIPWLDGKRIIGRVTDTGGHFRGASKVYRMVGFEPIDVCVASAQTPVPKTVVATIMPGDNLAGGKAVATAGLKDQTVAAGIVEGYTTDDYEALAGALETIAGRLSDDEAIAIGWTLRNRAAQGGVPLSDLIGARGKGSTRALKRADSVLGTPLADPTGGANDYWLPKLQAKLNLLGDIYRAAVAHGDAKRAAKYAPYAKYGTVETVRERLAREGAETTNVVGCVELLRRA